MHKTDAAQAAIPIIPGAHIPKPKVLTARTTITIIAKIIIPSLSFPVIRFMG